ncbi:MAG: SecC motif-containing protein [bacterium]|nr:SecC motif-containing protein [bacterium]
MKNLSAKTECPCGSKKDYNDCCGIFHSKKSEPITVEELMRSRYSAFSKKIADYLTNTLHPNERKKNKNKLSQSQLNQATWLKLEIIKTSHGNKADKIGKVEFKAHYTNGIKIFTHHELSRFKKHNGTWYYVDGKILIDN